MAGTIFGLGLSQRVDTNGNPDSGWLLYIYSANSSTPVTAYKDTALTTGLEHPWPIEADSSGMMPSFWLADGSYRVRATSNDGARTFYDLGSVLALGASSGSAPSGGVDAAAIFQTGDVMWLDVSGTRSGWVRDNGRTIGSATSGATERANSDCQSLFSFLWNNFDDTICAVSTGRGANAAADWAANKQIALPDKRGYIVGGLDDMGNSAAGRYASAPVISGDVTTAGSVIGEAAGALTQSNLPSVDFTVSIPSGQGDHAHTIQVGDGGGNAGLIGAGANSNQGIRSGLVQPTTLPSLSGTAASGGSGAVVNKVQKTVLGTFYRKL